jgi:hypothetical protein
MMGETVDLTGRCGNLASGASSSEERSVRSAASYHDAPNVSPRNLRARIGRRPRTNWNERFSVGGGEELKR